MALDTKVINFQILHIVTLNIIQGGVKMSIQNLFFSEMRVFRTTVGALGKLFAEGAFTTVFLYTTELYPTVMRSVKYIELIFCTFTSSIYYPEALSKQEFY